MNQVIRILISSSFKAQLTHFQLKIVHDPIRIHLSRLLKKLIHRYYVIESFDQKLIWI